jgi:hypothetical protein
VCLLHDRHAGILRAILDLQEGCVETGEPVKWRDVRSRWCMRHIGANFFRQFKNKHLMDMFKRLCVAELSELFRFKCINHHLQRQDDLKCTSNGTTHGSGWSPPDATTVTQNQSRLYSYKKNSRYITTQAFIT